MAAEKSDVDSKHYLESSSPAHSIGYGVTETGSVRGVPATDINGNPLMSRDRAAEAKLRLKIDLLVIPPVTLLYLFCFIDRANIGNAKIAGLDADLKLKGYDYNIILTSFYISYVIFEIPSNILCKLVGPGWFIPALTLGFGLLSLCTAFVNTMAQACAVRFLLGIFEAGMMPGVAYYMSRWYRRSELAFRLSFYIAMGPVGGAVGGLLASGIFKLDRFGSLQDWRMLFAIEGIITIGLALFGFLTMTDRPETARWLSAEEKELATSRILSERVGTTEVLDKMDWPKTIRGILNPTTLTTGFIFLLTNITVQGLGFFLPTIIRTIYPKNTLIFQQLRTVPPYAVGTFFTIGIPLLSWRWDNRNTFIMLSAPLVITGYIMFVASNNPQVRYGATFLIASGAFANGALCNAQVSANVISDTARSSAIGVNVMMGNIGGLIATWSFLPFDAPNYHIGNGLNLATSTTILITSFVLMFWMVRDNKKREKIDVDAKLHGLSQKQVQDLDWRHPAFRWKP